MPRATGIERVNQQINRPTATGAVASAHVSAAPGAGAAVHAHVMSARNPAGGPIQTRGPATRAPGSSSRQDASVQIIDRRTGGGGGGGFATKPTVQLLDQIPRREQEIFSVEQLNLMGSLLGQYAERVAAIGEHKDAATARDAIQKIGTMLKSNVSVNARQPSPSTRRRSGSACEPTGHRPRSRSMGQVAAPSRGPGHRYVPASGALGARWSRRVRRAQAPPTASILDFPDTGPFTPAPSMPTNPFEPTSPPGDPGEAHGRSREHGAADDTAADPTPSSPAGTVPSPTLEAWAMLLAPAAATRRIQMPYALQWVAMESGGNPCAVGYPPAKGPDGAPKEMGIAQFYNPDDLQRIGLSSRELRAYCIPGDQHKVMFHDRLVRGFSSQLRRALTSAEMQTQAVGTIRLIADSMARQPV
jgi:hypothetical protein